MWVVCKSFHILQLIKEYYAVMTLELPLFEATQFLYFSSACFKYINKKRT